MMLREAATKPPIEASDLENVPAMMSTSSARPKCAAVPSPLGPRTPMEWASSMASAANFRSDRGERLGERPRDDVHLVGEAEVRGRAVTLGAQDADGVGIVDGERRALALAHPEEP